MIYLAGIVITFFLATLLTGKKNKTPADRILMVWLCAIGIHLLLFYLFIAGKIYNYPFLLGTHLPYPLIHGPLLYFYTAELTRQQPKNRMTSLLHLLPVIVLYLFMIPFFNLSAAEKINVYRNKGAGYETIIHVCFWAIIISGIVYVTASLFLLRRYRRSIENEFSNIEKINLAWLRYLIFGIAVIWLAVILGNDNLIFALVVLFVFLLGYFGVRQVGIFTSSFQSGHKLPLVAASAEIVKETDKPVNQHPHSVKEADQKETTDNSLKVKYEKSGLDEDKADTIYKRLVGCMTNQKIFTDSELTLAALAKTLEVHPNHLSQVIRVC
jgi:hypothetical protein